MKKRKTVVAASLWLTGWMICSIWATLFTSSDFQLSHALLSPQLTWENWTGHDAFGRNVLHSVLRGSFISLSFAFTAVLISISCSTLFGISTVFSPDWLQRTAKIILEFFIGIPGLVLALAVAAVNGPGWSTLLLALILGVLPSLARLVQSRTRELIMEGYTQAARALGASKVHITRRHLLRSIAPLIAAKLPQVFAHCLLAEATLTFLGVGAPLGNETWGSLLAQGRDYLLEAPQIAWFAGLPLTLTLLSVQTLGDTLGRNQNASFRG